MENEEGEHQSPNFLKKLKSIKIFIIAGFLVLGLVAFIMIILAVTVYKSKDPIAMVDGVVIRSLDTSQNEPSVSVDLNLSVRNPGKAIFKSKKAIAYLSYRGVKIAKTEFEVGKIAPGATKPIAVTLTSEAGRLQGSPAINLELKTGNWPLNIETKISGKVPVFRMIKVPVFGTQLCGFLIKVQEKTIMGPKCLF